MRSFGNNIWLLDGDPVRMLGIPFPTRMTVVRLGNGGLWLHSPIAATDERIRKVEQLGAVRHIVAPNKFHHLFVEPWQKRFPDAQTWAGPGLVQRRKHLHFDHELGDRAEAVWAEHLDQLIFAGSKILPEVVFLHRPSRSVIFTDIVQNHDPALQTPFWRLVKRFNGVLAPNGGAPRDWRLTVRDAEAARRSLDRVLDWSFDKVVVAHGICTEQGGHATVERAFRWLR